MRTRLQYDSDVRRNGVKNDRLRMRDGKRNRLVSPRRCKARKLARLCILLESVTCTCNNAICFTRRPSSSRRECHLSSCVQSGSRTSGCVSSPCSDSCAFSLSCQQPYPRAHSRRRCRARLHGCAFSYVDVARRELLRQLPQDSIPHRLAGVRHMPTFPQDSLPL